MPSHANIFCYVVKVLSLIPLHWLCLKTAFSEEIFFAGTDYLGVPFGKIVKWAGNWFGFLQTWNMNEKLIVIWILLTPIYWIYSAKTSWVPTRCSALRKVQDIHGWMNQVWFLICILLVKVEIGLTILENYVTYLLKLNICIPDGPTITELGIYTTEICTCVHQKTCFSWTYIYSSIIWNSSK